jgi:hypothetical protein
MEEQKTTPTNDQKDNSIVVGVAWDQVSKKGVPYQSIAFLGKKETDEYEVILRRKSDGSELALYESSCSMFTSTKKEGDNPKKPNKIIRVFLS